MMLTVCSPGVDIISARPLDSVLLTSYYPVDMTAQEFDEDEEQRLINEGNLPLFPARSRLSSSNPIRRVQNMEEELSLPL